MTPNGEKRCGLGLQASSARVPDAWPFGRFFLTLSIFREGWT